MNCPKCHGKGDFLKLAPRVPQSTNIGDYFKFVPCDHPGCHAGQISCAEGVNRDEAGR